MRKVQTIKIEIPASFQFCKSAALSVVSPAGRIRYFWRLLGCRKCLFVTFAKSNRSQVCFSVLLFGDSQLLPKAAPYAIVVSVTRHKCYAISPLVSCASRICLCDTLIVQGQFPLCCRFGQGTWTDNNVCIFQTSVIRCFKVNRQKSHKIHRIENLHITIRTESFARCIFISENFFFWCPSFWRLFYLHLDYCHFSYLVAIWTKSVSDT